MDQDIISCNATKHYKSSSNLHLSKMDLYVSMKVQELYDDVEFVKNDIHNKSAQTVFINHIADMIEYTIATKDRMFSQQMLEFMIDLFMIVGALDYDSVETVLNALTSSRIILKNLIQ